MEYYYHKDSEIYHCKKSCANNSNPKAEWKKSTIPPVDKKQCDKCKMTNHSRVRSYASYW